MENQPLISPQSRFRLEPIPENPDSSVIIPHSISTSSFFHEIVQQQERVHHHHHHNHHNDLEESDEDENENEDSKFYFSNPRPLHRCRTAPAMVIFKDIIRPKISETKISKSIINQAIFLLIVYLTLGVSIYSFNRDHYSGIETHPVVDALYFCIVTMCTIGYGDIAPLTPWTKIFAVVFVLFGFGFLDILLSGVVNYVLDLQESMLLTGIQMGSSRRARFSAKDYIIDFEKGRMRIRIKVFLALCVVVLCIGIGALVLCFVEELDFVDSVYLSVMSVTTVGYGDRAFKTLQGRLFAAAWLLISTLAVARAFLYLAEARIDRRHRKAVKSALNREITVEDLLAADTYQHGFIRKAIQDRDQWLAAQALNVDNAQSFEPRVRTPAVWKKPNPGFLKCNIGYHWIKHQKLCGSSWILRNHFGQVLCHGRATFSSISNSIVAKYKTIDWAMESMTSLRYDNVVFASDAHDVLGAVILPKAWPSFALYHQELSLILRSFSGFSIFLEALSANRSATLIAHSVKSPRFRQSYVACSGPRWLGALLDAESSTSS